jgi:hypothetical protein
MGYMPKGGDRSYTFDNLFDLIDGGAEVYRSLNVRSVLDCTYAKKESADIIVDLFDMGSPSDAFGAFHYDLRENQDVGIGQESEYQGGSVFFWKERYFVSVVALEETAQTKEAVIAMGRAIASAIPTPGEKPKIVALLPSEGHAKEQLYYFHDDGSLERRYAIGNGNPLRLSKKTEGLLARYRVGGKEDTKNQKIFAVLLIVAYPSAAEAELALSGLYSTYLKGAKAGAFAQIQNKNWAAACYSGSRLFAVLQAPTRDAAKRLLDSAVARNSKQR